MSKLKYFCIVIIAVRWTEAKVFVSKLIYFCIVIIAESGAIVKGTLVISHCRFGTNIGRDKASEVPMNPMGERI